MSNASPQPAILLVEDDSPLFNEIKSLMGFMGFDTFYVNDLDALTGALNSGEFTCVLLGDFQGERSRVDALQKIQSSGLSVLLFNKDKTNLEKYQSQFEQVLGHLEMPLKYEPVADALKNVSASDAVTGSWPAARRARSRGWGAARRDRPRRR